MKYSGTSERTIRRDIKYLNDYFKRNYENEGSNGVYREISYCRKDKDYASRVLLHVNYYRLSGYTLTLRRDNIFYNNVKLEQVMEIYNFDTELRVITEKL
ncbi:Abi family protein [Clostridium sp. ZBS12]|uniref:Abi family protein n=1 Tax=Clostridium sp. ZBS12 TaxID=2949972 RepID=UPI00207A43C4